MTGRHKGDPAILSFYGTHNRLGMNPGNDQLRLPESFIYNAFGFLVVGDPAEIQKLHGNKCFRILRGDNLCVFGTCCDGCQRSDVVEVSVTDQNKINFRVINFLENSLIIRKKFIFF